MFEREQFPLGRIQALYECTRLTDLDQGVSFKVVHDRMVESDPILHQMTPASPSPHT